jgi:hypothetical protein
VEVLASGVRGAVWLNPSAQVQDVPTQRAQNEKKYGNYLAQ